MILIQKYFVNAVASLLFESRNESTVEHLKRWNEAYYVFKDLVNLKFTQYKNTCKDSCFFNTN